MTSRSSRRNETFASIMNSFNNHFDAHRVFDDFLTLAMCAVTQIPGEGKSHYEELYLRTIEPYKKHDLCNRFAHALAQLIIEMKDGIAGDGEPDVLGTYYEQNISRRKLGQYFTPWSVCQLMAQLTLIDTDDQAAPKRFVDPCCGSGRMLLAGAKVNGQKHHYYGIDIDHTCAKMTALNLFLNGVFGGEVMCANALQPDSFEIAYKISMFPLGIFRIEEKEHSVLWRNNQSSFEKKVTAQPEFRETNVKPGGPQLQLF